MSATQTLLAELRAMIEPEGIDPEVSDTAAENVLAMPGFTETQRKQRLLAWVTILPPLRGLRLMK